MIIGPEHHGNYIFCFGTHQMAELHHFMCHHIKMIAVWQIFPVCLVHALMQIMGRLAYALYQRGILLQSSLKIFLFHIYKHVLLIRQEERVFGHHHHRSGVKGLHHLLRHIFVGNHQTEHKLTEPAIGHNQTSALSP